MLSYISSPSISEHALSFKISRHKYREYYEVMMNYVGFIVLPNLTIGSNLHYVIYHYIKHLNTCSRPTRCRPTYSVPWAGGGKMCVRMRVLSEGCELWDV